MPAFGHKQYCSMWNGTTPGDDLRNQDLNEGNACNLFAAAR